MSTRLRHNQSSMSGWKIASAVSVEPPGRSGMGLPPAPPTDGSPGGSQEDGPVSLPLAQLQLSMNGVSLLGRISEQASRGVLVYGWTGGSVEAGPLGVRRGRCYPPRILCYSPFGLCHS